MIQIIITLWVKYGKVFADRWLYSEKHHRAISRQANPFSGVEDFHPRWISQSPASSRAVSRTLTASGVRRWGILTPWMALFTSSFLPVKFTPDLSPSGFLFHRNNSKGWPCCRLRLKQALAFCLHSYVKFNGS